MIRGYDSGVWFEVWFEGMNRSSRTSNHYIRKYTPKKYKPIYQEPAFACLGILAMRSSNFGEANLGGRIASCGPQLQLPLATQAWLIQTLLPVRLAEKPPLTCSRQGLDESHGGVMLGPCPALAQEARLCPPPTPRSVARKALHPPAFRQQAPSVELHPVRGGAPGQSDWSRRWDPLPTQVLASVLKNRSSNSWKLVCFSMFGFRSLWKPVEQAHMHAGFTLQNQQSNTHYRDFSI